MNKDLELDFISEFFQRDCNIENLIVKTFRFEEKNLLFNADFLMGLKFMIEKNLDNSCFVYINKDDQMNARVATKDDCPIIGIFSGSIIKILRMINLILLGGRITFFDNDFLKSTPKSINVKITIDKKDYSVKTLKDIRMRNMAYLISRIALCIVVFHEVGHHINGDLIKLKETRGLNFNDALDYDGDEARVNMELHADYFAIDRVVDDLGYLLDYFSGNGFEISLYTVFQILVLTLTVIRRNLQGNYVPQRKEIMLKRLPPTFRTQQNIIYLLLHMEKRFPHFARELIDLCNHDGLIKTRNQILNYEIDKNNLSLDMLALVAECEHTRWDGIYHMVCEEHKRDYELFIANDEKIFDFILSHDIHNTQLSSYKRKEMPWLNFYHNLRF